MKKILLLAFLIVSAWTFGQQQVFNLSVDNVIDKEYVNIQSVDLTPTYLLSGETGTIQKIPVIDSDTLYPRIITAASDTTGRIAEKAGDMFINTATGKVYVSTGAGRGKYVILNFFLMVLLILGKGKCEEK